MADMIPSIGHIKPNYVMGYDIRPLETMKERESFLKKAVSDEYILFFEHDLSIECGTSLVSITIYLKMTQLFMRI